MADAQTEFWLPPEFLTDDYILAGVYGFDSSKSKAPPRSNPLFHSELCFHDFCNSPVSDSDEDGEILAGITRRLTRAHIGGEVNKPLHAAQKNWVLSKSPQSTLAMVDGYSGRSSGSSNGASLVSSPPTTPLGGEIDAWDLIYQDRAQAERLKMSGVDGSACKIRDLTRILNSGHPVQISPFHQVRAGQMVPEMWGRKVNESWTQTRVSRVGSNPGQIAAAWHSMQQIQNHNKFGSGQFSGGFVGGGGGGLKRESAGTGVFIPRRYNSNNNNQKIAAADSRRKTGRSAAPLLPTKLVNGSNTSLDGFNGFPQPGLISEYDLMIARRNAASLLAHRIRSMSPEVPMSPESRLPPEWTY